MSASELNKVPKLRHSRTQQKERPLLHFECADVPRGQTALATERRAGGRTWRQGNNAEDAKIHVIRERGVRVARLSREPASVEILRPSSRVKLSPTAVLIFKKHQNVPRLSNRAGSQKQTPQKKVYCKQVSGYRLASLPSHRHAGEFPAGGRGVVGGGRSMCRAGEGRKKISCRLFSPAQLETRL